MLYTIQELVKSAQAGEKAAWTVLYRQFYPPLYALALPYSKTIQIAQDLVQETFITAYLHLSQLNEPSAFGGWIKKILIREGYRQSRKRVMEVALDSYSAPGDRWWEDAFDKKTDELARQSNLSHNLTLLPESLRITLLLRYFTEFNTYEDIARILAIPIGTVRSRLNQSKINLAQKWIYDHDNDYSFFKENEEWNSFYIETATGFHHRDDCKHRFVNHLNRKVQIVDPDGQPSYGRILLEQKIEEDRTFGSWLKPDQVLSSGNISVLEIRHFNSPEHPHHCPERSVMLLYRNQSKVVKIRLQIFPE